MNHVVKSFHKALDAVPVPRPGVFNQPHSYYAQSVVCLTLGYLGYTQADIAKVERKLKGTPRQRLDAALRRLS